MGCEFKHSGAVHFVGVYFIGRWIEAGDAAVGGEPDVVVIVLHKGAYLVVSESCAFGQAPDYSFLRVEEAQTAAER